jgi:hypothetical protein
MAWRFVVIAAMGVAGGGALAVGCGATSSGHASGSADGGAPEASAGDAFAGDAPQGDAAGGDAGAWPDGAVAPHGKQLVKSTTVVLEALTSDGYAIYTDLGPATPTLGAAPVDGGAPIPIGDYDLSGVAASGTVVVFFDAIVQTTNAGTLRVWTAAQGEQTLSTSALLGAPGSGLLDVSDDGRHVLLFDDVSATTADVVAIDVDGSNRTVLVPGVRLDDAACPPSVGFAGAYAIVSYCPPPGDAGADASAADGGATTAATIAAFTGAGWATAAQVTTAAFTGFASDGAGQRLQFVTASGLVVAQLGSWQTAALDPAGLEGIFTSDGAHVVYVTADGSIKVAPSDGTSAPVTLQAGGFEDLYALSADDRWLVAAKQRVSDQNTGVTTSDLYLVSAVAPGPATALEATPIAGLSGDAFTADSRRALFTTNIVASSALPVGDLFYAPTGGGSRASLGGSVWSDVALRGGAVLFNANFAIGTGASAAGADIEWVDTSTATPPVVLVTLADPDFFTTAAGDEVVYSWSYAQGDRAGIWALPLP